MHGLDWTGLEAPSSSHHLYLELYLLLQGLTMDRTSNAVMTPENSAGNADLQEPCSLEFGDRKPAVRRVGAGGSAVGGPTTVAGDVASQVWG